MYGVTAAQSAAQASGNGQAFAQGVASAQGVDDCLKGARPPALPAPMFVRGCCTHSLHACASKAGSSQPPWLTISLEELSKTKAVLALEQWMLMSAGNEQQATAAAMAAAQSFGGSTTLAQANSAASAGEQPAGK